MMPLVQLIEKIVQYQTCVLPVWLWSGLINFISYATPVLLLPRPKEQPFDFNRGLTLIMDR
uniref:Uncharacterized protein n=1 Tax=Anopheles atroparvus TaxID=41427 RepID=A0AAG5DC68_ANOAO